MQRAFKFSSSKAFEIDKETAFGNFLYLYVFFVDLYVNAFVSLYVSFLLCRWVVFFFFFCSRALLRLHWGLSAENGGVEQSSGSLPFILLLFVSYNRSNAMVHYLQENSEQNLLRNSMENLSNCNSLSCGIHFSYRIQCQPANFLIFLFEHTTFFICLDKKIWN